MGLTYELKFMIIMKKFSQISPSINELDAFLHRKKLQQPDYIVIFKSIFSGTKIAKKTVNVRPGNGFLSQR